MMVVGLICGIFSRAVQDLFTASGRCVVPSGEIATNGSARDRADNAEACVPSLSFGLGCSFTTR